MTEIETRAAYLNVEALFSIIKQKDITLTVLPKNNILETTPFREVSFQSPSYSCIIPVYDEYEDAESDNQALLLQLVIYMIEEYEDCEDFFVWNTSYGLDASVTSHLERYKQIGSITHKIRAIIGNNFCGISDFDWQLNAGAAQALRKLKR